LLKFEFKFTAKFNDYKQRCCSGHRVETRKSVDDDEKKTTIVFMNRRMLLHERKKTCPENRLGMIGMVVVL